MERVLKRVRLTKRSSSGVQQEAGTATVAGASTIAPPSHIEDTPAAAPQRRRRRSASRRRANANADGAARKKPRGLFNIDWGSVRECRACRSRAISRRLCGGRRADNELYRSNSFKFERFVRGSEEVLAVSNKISLCDDYSVPADDLNKTRPNSIAAPSLSEWIISSPNEEKVEILETYSNPRDSTQQLTQEENDAKCFTSPDREYSQPYTTEGSSEPSSDEEFFGHRITLRRPQPELNSPDSIAEAILPSANVQSPIRTDIKRHPSPYYYGDLYKNKTVGSPLPPSASRYQKSRSLEKPDDANVVNYSQIRRHNFDQNTDNQKGLYGSRTSKSSNFDTPILEEPHRVKHYSQLAFRKSSSVETQSTDSRDATTNDPGGNANRLPTPCVCFGNNDGLDVADEMTRQRHLYETAFDCRINKSDDDLDQMDKVSNHPVLVQLNGTKCHNRAGPSSQSDGRNRRKPPPPPEDGGDVAALTQHLQLVQLQMPGSSAATSSLRRYTPSPPSSAPLPAKFHGKELIMNSIRSAPHIPSHSKSRHKELRPAIKSLRGRIHNTASSGSIFEIEFGHKSDVISEFKGRPAKGNKDRADVHDRSRTKKETKHTKEPLKDSVVEFKVRRRRPKYSSTESMTTSSSCGSMESIRSSTSEGNRSTSSSESHHSSSLSSHESDSGGPMGFSLSQSSGYATHATKLHILSPISDKSSQEPISETSDNARNNNSQKCSPDEVVTPENMKIKRRMPQNKNLLNLGFHEIQGSDSGISIQSREGIKSLYGFTAELSAPSQQDFSDLPFDMPKLRRRRILPQDVCTSGSATSVDLRDLPFDMPKLRRRLRFQQSSTESSVSQASSSQSVIEVDRQVTNFRPKLTLNLGDVGKRHRPGLGLTLIGFGPLVNVPKSNQSFDVIDINIPLEKQGWYHGAITRIEAESVLRLLKEGSFLVRNSESTRQDYSLSLKSACGFMHMRIQRDCVNGSFILGQFSKPFQSIPEMINHFSLNRLPIRGAEHMCLIQPVIAQLL